MPAWSADDRVRLRAIKDELDTVRLGGGDAIPIVLDQVRELLETDSVVIVCPVMRSDGWQLERSDSCGFAVGDGFARRFRKFLDDAPERYAWYDAVRPEPRQRNVVVEAISQIPPGELETSRIYREVLAPLGLQRHKQLRALVCDGPSLLGWFGAFHTGEVSARQHRVLQRIVPWMRRRLTLERCLAGAPRAFAALEAALAHIGAPAFVVDDRGTVFETNEAGRALLDQRPTEVGASLRATIAGRPSPLRFQATSLRDRGARDAWLAILRTGSTDERIAACVATAATRWSLTRRQAEILGHVVAGMATATIAAVLGIGSRAVELQITQIFDRGGVENRASLVASVLLGD
jgi:DNA-binding CsgD family transcriptional regulator